MAGLGALLGGYGSDEDEGEEQQGSPANALPLLGVLGGVSSASPTKADQLATAAAAGGTSAPAVTTTSNASQQPSAAGADSDTDTSRLGLPLRVMDGPSTNPEPPPEGSSPPLGETGINTITADAHGAADSEMNDAGIDPALLILPPELREAPPGQPHPLVQKQVEFFHQRTAVSGTSVVSAMRKNRRWNNPNFLDWMVHWYHLDQYGSSFDPAVFDPKSIPEEDKWPALAAQLAARKRARGADVKFSSAGPQQLAAVPAGAIQQAAAAAAVAAAAGIAAAPKMLPPDPRKVEAAQAQAQALANSLLSGAKKSKWDK